MAHDARLTALITEHFGKVTPEQAEAARRFAEAVAAAERSACARLVIDLCAYTGGHGEPKQPTGEQLAHFIMERGRNDRLPTT